MSQRIPSTMIRANDVPEPLIESVQTVLQSKSRNVIIRELTRTVIIVFRFLTFVFYCSDDKMQPFLRL
jgi:hypothetical protein